MIFIIYRRKGGRVQIAAPVYDSDDERAYEKEKVPDPTEDDYFYDEVDEFHQERDKVSTKQFLQITPRETTHFKDHMSLANK